MNKYPVLEKISPIARAGGWVALIPAVLICLTGAVNVLGGDFLGGLPMASIPGVGSPFSPLAEQCCSCHCYSSSSVS